MRAFLPVLFFAITACSDLPGYGEDGTRRNDGVGTEYGILFDGLEDFAATDDQGPSLSTLTVEAWVRPAALGTVDLVHQRDPNNNPGRGWALGLTNGRPDLTVYHPEPESVSASSALAVDSWTFLAATVHGSSLAIFVDGTLAATHTASEPPDPMEFAHTMFALGGDGQHSLFHGLLDEVRLSTTVRYTESFERPAAPFEADADTHALWHLDEQTHASDASGNGWRVHFDFAEDLAEPPTLPQDPPYRVEIDPIGDR